MVPATNLRSGAVIKFSRRVLKSFVDDRCFAERSKARRGRNTQGALLVIVALLTLFPVMARAEVRIRAAMLSVPQILDPNFTVAWISQFHGLMIYDVLFA